jgi:hypothetical protein
MVRLAGARGACWLFEMKDRGSWTWWIGQLEALRFSLPAPRPFQPEQLPLLVRNPDPVESAETLRAVRWLAKTGAWPDASAGALQQLDLRLAHAIEVCALKRKERAPAPSETFPEVLCWLLLDCWTVSATIWADAEAQAARPNRKRD